MRRGESVNEQQISSKLSLANADQTRTNQATGAIIALRIFGRLSRVTSPLHRLVILPVKTAQSRSINRNNYFTSINSMAPKTEVTANDTPEVDDKTHVVAAKGKRKVKEEEEEEEEKPIVKKKRGVVVTTTKVAKPVVAEKTVKKNTNSGGAVASGSGSSGSGSGSIAHRLPVSPSLLKIGDVLSPGEGQLDYIITQPEPIRNVDGDFHFKDEARFRPNVSPEEIIRQGSFGGGYWRVIKSKKTGVTYKNDWGDMPKCMLMNFD